MEEKKTEKLYNAKQITKLLEIQVSDCAESIDVDQLTGYTAKKKILATKLVKI